PWSTPRPYCARRSWTCSGCRPTAGRRSTTASPTSSPTWSRGSPGSERLLRAVDPARTRIGHSRGGAHHARAPTVPSATTREGGRYTSSSSGHRTRWQLRHGCSLRRGLPGGRRAGAPRVAGEGGPPRRRQVPVPGGNVVMGDHFDEGYPADGELPLHEVRVSPFRMDESAVTNAQFATFCKATGYVTDAEQLGVSPVFHLAVEASRSDVLHALDAAPWWLSVRGADWRHPAGPRSSITDLQTHPVVHV